MLDHPYILVQHEGCKGVSNDIIATLFTMAMHYFSAFTHVRKTDNLMVLNGTALDHPSLVKHQLMLCDVCV